MTLPEFFLWLQESPLGVGIRESGTAFPWVESIHVLTGTIVLGTISIVDLRLMGLASRAFPVSKVLHDTLPFTVTNFLMSVVTGSPTGASRTEVFSGPKVAAPSMRRPS